MEKLLAAFVDVSAGALSTIGLALRPALKAAVKGYWDLADVAKGATVAAGQYWNQQAATESSESKADDAPIVAEGAQAAAVVVAPAEDAVAAQVARQDTPEVQTKAGQEELLQIDGIGPKTADVLAKSNIATLEQLAASDELQLRAILSGGGARYRAVDPSSWPAQARRLLEN